VSQFSGAEFSSETIECLGGIKAKSKDGAMTFDNTIDARIERLKPLIRKEIAAKFGVGN
jgi:V/A-type H+-transporting ATPase subunit E